MPELPASGISPQDGGLRKIAYARGAAAR